jgi:hypothetical protein
MGLARQELHLRGVCKLWHFPKAVHGLSVAACRLMVTDKRLAYPSEVYAKDG